MVSKRVNFDLRKNSLRLRYEEELKAGADVIDLTISNPTSVGLNYPESQILEALSSPESLRYEPSATGLKKARQAIAESYQRRGFGSSPDDILLTSSTSEAYSFLFKLLLDPGGIVLLPQPSYPLFEFLARMESLKTASYSLYYDDGWHYDFESIEFQLRRGIKVILLVNPNNPTGSFIREEEWSRLKGLCLDHQVTLICDEVFRDCQLEDDSAHFDFLPEGDIPLFLLNGLSKRAGLPQVKLSWINVCGPREVSKQTISHLELISDTYLSVGTPVQHAVPTLLRLSDGIHRQILTRIRSNYRSLREACTATAVDPLRTQGGWYATLRLPRSQSSEEWALYALESKNVLVHPGYFFGFPEEAHLVVSLLAESDRFDEGIRRLVETVESF